MVYVEAPNKTESNLKGLFLAGSITGTKDWQDFLIDKISDLDIVVYNPRRKKFDISDSKIEKEQITWEHNHLRKADAISFWFAKETPAPITLYELGAMSATQKPIVIGIHPDYSRKSDVEIQMELVRTDIPIVYSLSDLADEIFKMMNQIISV